MKVVFSEGRVGAGTGQGWRHCIFPTLLLFPRLWVKLINLQKVYNLC